MADRRTTSILRRRARAKTVGFVLFGMLLGLALKLLLDFQPVEAFSNVAESLTGWVPALGVWLEAHPDIRAWVAGPVALGVACLVLAVTPWGRTVLNRLFPDPPPFVRSSLDEARHRDRVLSLEGPPLPFVGRSDGLTEAERLLVTERRPFAWRALTGPSGIGKTRLAIEWLEKARAKGWDVGILDRDDFALVKGWKARRSTALVVDEARNDWGDRLGELLTAFAGAGTARAPVRALVVDQIQPQVDIRGGDDRAMVRAAGIGASLRLRRLDEAEVLGLCAASARAGIDKDIIVRESAGLPRAALILINASNATNYADALMEWVERLEPSIADEGRPLRLALAGPLFLASLAGPIDADVVRELCGDVDAAALAKFFPESEARSLDRQVPALTPDDLAIALLLRLIPRFDLRRRETMVDLLLRDMPAEVEARLGSIWRARPDLDRAGGGDCAASALQWLQQRFDRIRPRDVENAHARAAGAMHQLEENDPALRSTALAGLADLADLADSRPFDPKLRILEARGAAVAIGDYGESGNIAEMERWGARLVAAAARFPDLWEVREAEAWGAKKAIIRYAALGIFDAVEDWGRAPVPIVRQRTLSIKFGHQAMGGRGLCRRDGRLRGYPRLRPAGAVGRTADRAGRG